MKTFTQSSDNNFPLINQLILILKLKDFDLNSVDFLRDKSLQIAKELNLTVVKESFHQFEPFGITYINILSQSHLILHTWPEHSLLHIDLVTCSESIDKKDIEDKIKKIFQEKNIVYFDCKQIS